MDVKMTEALRGYGVTRATEVSSSEETGDNFFGRAAQDFAETLKQSEELATSALTSKADPHALVESLANTQLAVETAVTVRDRVVEAYQEILRMPV